MVMPLVHGSACLLFGCDTCVVAKWCVLAKSCLKKQTGLPDHYPVAP